MTNETHNTTLLHEANLNNRSGGCKRVDYSLPMIGYARRLFLIRPPGDTVEFASVTFNSGSYLWQTTEALLQFKGLIHNDGRLVEFPLALDTTKYAPVRFELILAHDICHQDKLQLWGEWERLGQF